MPYDNVDGIGLGCIVENTGNPLRVPVSEALLGKALNIIPPLTRRAA